MYIVMYNSRIPNSDLKCLHVMTQLHDKHVKMNVKHVHAQEHLNYNTMYNVYGGWVLESCALDKLGIMKWYNLNHSWMSKSYLWAYNIISTI